MMFSCGSERDGFARKNKEKSDSGGHHITPIFSLQEPRSLHKLLRARILNLRLANAPLCSSTCALLNSNFDRSLRLCRGLEVDSVIEQYKKPRCHQTIITDATRCWCTYATLS
jgi:hypothetical protein